MVAPRPPTVLTCGNLRLSLPSTAAIPKLHLNADSSVSVTFSNFSGTVSFDALPNPASPPPLEIDPTPQPQLQAPSLEQSLQTHLITPPMPPTSQPTTSQPPMSQSVEDFLSYQPSQVRPCVLPFSSQLPVTVPLSSAPLITSEPMSLSQSHMPMSQSQIPISQSQVPDSFSQPLSHFPSLPETQVPDNLTEDSDALPVVSTPSLPHFPGPLLQATPPSSPDISLSEPELKPKPELKPSVSQRKPIGRPRGRPPKIVKSLKPSLPHPSSLSHVESRGKNGKRVRFEEKPTVVPAPPRKKHAPEVSKNPQSPPSKDSSPDSSPEPSSPPPTPVVSPQQKAPPSPWRTLDVPEAARPANRWGSTFTRLNDTTVLMLGGESEARGMFKDMHVFNTATSSWLSEPKHAPPLPAARAWHTTVRLENTLFVFGGEVEEDNEREQTNDALVYDATYFTWYPPSLNGTPPSARAGHCAAVFPGTKHVVVYGGISKNRWMNDLFILEDMLAWTKVRPSNKSVRPSARSYASLTPANGFLVLFGGNNKTRNFNDVHLLSTDRTWSEPVILTRTPPPRTGHCAVPTKDGKGVIVYGGWDDQGETRLFFSDVWLLRVKSITECQWTCLYAGDNSVKTPGPRAGAALCAAGDGEDMLLFGGWHQCSYYNDIHKLDLGAEGLKFRPSPAKPSR